MKLRLAIALCALLAACGDATPGTEPQTVVGTYRAVRNASVNNVGLFSLTTNHNGEIIDWVKEGLTIELVLADDGTTTGWIFIPMRDGYVEDDQNGPLQGSLAGTWTMADGGIELDHETDTFLRDLTFVVEGNRLTAERTFGGGTDAFTVKVVLERAQ